MCGIAGWVDYERDLTQEKEVLDRMSETIAPRGPDSSGRWYSRNAAFAHRRLAVMDPAGGAQPMVRSRGGSDYVIVYNGELYNAPELKAQLTARGYTFNTTCDTEVLLVSYMEWGRSCMERLNGIFAFAIWDSAERRLFLARDRFGVKPLFYSILSGSASVKLSPSLIFASEIKAILAHPNVKPQIDCEGLGEIFALGPARTPGIGVFKGIQELKPAYCAVFDKNGFHTECYWSLESRPHTDGIEVTTARVSALVENAIIRQLVSDVPLCTFLSGGLDSSAITAVAAAEFAKKNRGCLDTYSIDYLDNSKYFTKSVFQPNSDSDYTALASEKLGTCHHNVYIDTPELAGALSDAVRARDLPGMTDVDSSLFLFCREVKKHATVALSGECA